jgi:hypothetical protein
MDWRVRPPYMSNFCCLPGRAGGTLKEGGLRRGQNVAVHWAQSNYDRLPELAADLVRRK